MNDTHENLNEGRNGGSPDMTCSRFTAGRVEELLQARDNLSEGDEISHRDACDLVNWYADELDRVRNAYQSRIGGLMLKAMELSNDLAAALIYPENA